MKRTSRLLWMISSSCLALVCSFITYAYCSPKKAPKTLISPVLTATDGHSTPRANFTPELPKLPEGPLINVQDPPYKAKGDGKTDDTSALQKALDAAHGKGATVLLPKGTYCVNAALNHGAGVYGLRLRSGLAMRFEKGATLKALPTSQGIYALLMGSDVQDIKIMGGVLEGERSTHQGTSGEWGMGIFLKRAQRVLVEGTLAKDCWGDGFYVSQSSDITLSKVTGDRNRRQGLSIIGADRMKVEGCTFQNTGGTLPEAGIDIEPDEGETVKNVLITGCLLANNSGFGITLGVPGAHTGKAWVTGVVLESNKYNDNGFSSITKDKSSGLEITNAEDIEARGETLEGNASHGILVRNRAHRVRLLKNKIWKNGGDGIFLYETRDGIVTGNEITGNAGKGIRTESTTGYTISDNVISGNKRR